MTRVRTAGTVALGQHGIPDDLALVLPVLQELAPPNRNGMHVSLEALAAIEALGRKAEPILPALRTMPRNDRNAPAVAHPTVASILPP